MSDRERPEVGIARLGEAISHLLAQVERLCDDGRGDHDSITDLGNRVETLAKQVGDLHGEMLAARQDENDRLKRLSDEALARAEREHRHDNLHRVIGEQLSAIQGRRAAWSARAGWLAVTLAGVAAGLLGDWLKRFFGLGGP